MDIRREILKSHSRVQRDKIVDYVGNNPTRFKVLVEVFLSGPYRVTQRSAWPISYCTELHPQLVKPHLKTLLDCLKTPGIHQAVKRNILRLLQFIDIPKRSHGQIADICFQYLSNRKEPIAVRCFAMTVLGNIARYNPDLKQELLIIVEDNLPYATPGFAARARRLLRELK
jgi:hypothetical protein